MKPSLMFNSELTDKDISISILNLKMKNSDVHLFRGDKVDIPINQHHCKTKCTPVLCVVIQKITRHVVLTSSPRTKAIWIDTF